MPARKRSVNSPLFRLIVTSGITTLVAGVFVTLTLAMSNDFSKQNQLSALLLKKENVINEMIRQIGYGHFIHNFKNFVIRRDEQYLNAAEDNYRRFLELLNEYRQLEQSEIELRHLEEIQKVLNTYKNHLTSMETLDLSDLTAQGLDRIVKVDDSQAAYALESLYEINQAQSRVYDANFLSQRERLVFLNVFGVVMLLLLLTYAGSNYLSQVKILTGTARERENRRFLEEVLNNTNSTVLVSDKYGRIVEANVSVFALTGYSREEILALSIEDLVPKHLRESHAKFRRFASGEKIGRKTSESRSADFQLLTKSGKEIFVAISISHIEVNDKSMVVSVIHDISEERKLTLDLQTSKKFLQQSQAVAKFSSWYWNIETGEVNWSEYATHIYGIKTLGTSFNAIVQFVHPEDKDYVVDAIQTTVVLRSDFNITYRLVLPNGDIRFIKEEGKPFLDDSGETVIIGTARNITEEHLNNEQLKMADLVFNHSQDGIIVTDESQRIQRINEAFTRITGYKAQEAINKTPRQLLKSDRHDAHFYEKFWYCINQKGEWSGNIWDVDASGNSFLSQQYVCKVIDEQTNRHSFVSIIRDITQAHLNEELLRKRAYFDNLTKLPNRMLFQDRLTEKLAKVRRDESRFALCFVDLDGFKQINDTYGHEAGDLVLKTVATNMVFTVRDSDTVSRLAGDEFTIILDEVSDTETALMVANKLIAKINEPVAYKEHSLVVGASFGIIIVNQESQDSTEQLLSFADKAMYEAKQAGKNRAVIYHHPEI